MYVYIRSEPNLFTVGFYDPSGAWMPESDYNCREEAGKRVHYLNGGTPEHRVTNEVLQGGLEL